MNHPKLPSLIGLRAFEAAARLGKMSRAADELCVTPGAVSRSIRHLEMEIGTSLFCGPKSDLKLTLQGVSLANSLATSFRQMEAAVAPYFNEDSGSICISCLGTFAMKWLIPKLANLHRTMPLVDIQISTSDRPIDFQREPHDLAIRITNHPIPQDAQVSVLFPEFIGPVVSPDFLKEHPMTTSAALNNLPVIGIKNRPLLHERWSRHGHFHDAVVAYNFEYFGYAIEAAKSGMGVCIAPWPLVMDHLQSGDLVAPLGFTPSGHSYIIARRNIRSRKIEKVCNWLVSEAKKTPQP